VERKEIRLDVEILKGRAWQAAHRKARRSLAAISDDDDAAVKRLAAGDHDNPPLDDRMLADLRPACEITLELVHRARGQRGPQKRSQ
jgi:hypothetical protein